MNGSRSITVRSVRKILYSVVNHFRSSDLVYVGSVILILILVILMTILIGRT